MAYHDVLVTHVSVWLLSGGSDTLLNIYPLKSSSIVCTAAHSLLLRSEVCVVECCKPIQVANAHRSPHLTHTHLNL